MILNGAMPKIEIDPETYAATADGELLVCDPTERLPMAQRYFFVLTTGEVHSSFRPCSGMPLLVVVIFVRQKLA